jgi:homogentisate 1,2-dioxygenase
MHETSELAVEVPLHLVGWDGYLYPWTFSVHDFEPITGRIHQPPPSQQTFQGRN